MSLFHVFYHVPGVSGALGQQIMAGSADAAARAVLAQHPNATIDRVVKIDGP